MSLAGKPSVPAFSPSWLSPQRIALAGAALLFADMILGQWLTPAGLSLVLAGLVRWPDAEGWVLLACFMVTAAASLACARGAMRAHSAVGTVLGCLGAGLAFATLNFATGGLLYHRRVPTWPLDGLFDDMTARMLGDQVLALVLSLAGLALPVSRSRRAPSCDAVHEALVVTGAWLLAVGTVVRWGAAGLGLGAFTRVAPGGWSLLCALPGLAMLVAGVAADGRLVRWLRSARAGGQPGWRVEPVADRDVQVLSLLGPRSTVAMDGVLVLDREAGPRAVASVYLEQDDRRWLVGARLKAVVPAVLLLFAVVPVTWWIVMPGMAGR